MTNIFVGRRGGKKQYDKKAAVKRQPKSVAQFCRSVKDK